MISSIDQSGVDSTCKGNDMNTTDAIAQSLKYNNFIKTKHLQILTMIGLCFYILSNIVTQKIYGYKHSRLMINI